MYTYKGGYGDPTQTIPLGMTVDSKGCLYVAFYYGGVVLKINPR